LDVMRWGLLPFWAKDMKVGFANINAIAEAADTKPASARRSSGGAGSCPSTTFMSGRKRRPASSPMRSRWPTAG
jgi:putative SOS response-associated peptidase YedK